MTLKDLLATKDGHKVFITMIIDTAAVTLGALAVAMIVVFLKVLIED